MVLQLALMLCRRAAQHAAVNGCRTPKEEAEEAVIAARVIAAAVAEVNNLCQVPAAHETK